MSTEGYLYLTDSIKFFDNFLLQTILMEHMVIIAFKFANWIPTLKTIVTKFAYFLGYLMIYVFKLESIPLQGDSVRWQFLLSHIPINFSLFAINTQKDEDYNQANVEVEVIIAFHQLRLFLHVHSIWDVNMVLLHFFLIFNLNIIKLLKVFDFAVTTWTEKLL